MEYIGLQQQITSNNRKSILLLLGFPALLLGLLWCLSWYTSPEPAFEFEMAWWDFQEKAPFVIFGVAVWFTIAWFSHNKMILKAAGSKPLERKENKRVYNLVENLCMSRGMKVPKIYIIEDDSLNAFASGLNEKTHSVSLSRGIIEKLNDEELEGVIAHELMHIRNKDVQLLVISVIFVGIFAFIAEFAFRAAFYSGGNRKGKKDNSGAILLAIAVLGLVGYLISVVFKLALSRKREYLADAGAAEMTRKPLALASALRKVAGDPLIEGLKRKDMAQMFIENPKEKTEENALTKSFSSIFATHPPIEKRIAILEQF